MSTCKKIFSSISLSTIAGHSSQAPRQLVKEKSKSPVLFGFHAFCLRDDEAHQTLASWLGRILPLRVVYPVGSNSSIYVVDESMKLPIRSLISMTYQMKAEGYCLSCETFVIDNLVICKNEIKPKNLYVRKRVLGNDEDFKHLSLFIRHTMFAGRENNIPLDMSRLLKLLETAPSNKLLIENHFALMDVRARRDYICQWFDIRGQFDTTEIFQYQRLCSKLPNISNWPTLLVKGSPLEAVYLKKTYTSQATQQPRFFRNALEHLLKKCRNCLIPTQPLLYVYDDCINMLFAVFSMAICDFVELLHSHNLLKILGPDKYFPGCSK